MRIRHGDSLPRQVLPHLEAVLGVGRSPDADGEVPLFVADLPVQVERVPQVGVVPGIKGSRQPHTRLDGDESPGPRDLSSHATDGRSNGLRANVWRPTGDLLRPLLAGLVQSRLGHARWSSRTAGADLRHVPRSRSHILPQRVALTRGRPDPEVAVVRRAPLVDDREDLDKLVLEGKPTRRLLTPRARVAVDVDRGMVRAHAVWCAALTARSYVPSVKPRNTGLS